jgi:hypothetical protein
MLSRVLSRVFVRAVFACDTVNIVSVGLLQAAAADKANAELAAAAKGAVDKLLELKKQLAEAQEA